jgi:hypothetical protein
VTTIRSTAKRLVALWWARQWLCRPQHPGDAEGEHDASRRQIYRAHLTLSGIGARE